MTTEIKLHRVFNSSIYDSENGNWRICKDEKGWLLLRRNGSDYTPVGDLWGFATKKKAIEHLTESRYFEIYN